MKASRTSRILAVCLAACLMLSLVGVIPTEVSAAAPTSYTTIREGEIKTVNISSGGQNVYFRLIPAYSGSYAFSSGGGVDAYGHLLDASGTELTYNDDGNGRNFYFTYNLTAGNTYYLRTRLYGTTATGSFTVSVMPPSNAIMAGQTKDVTISTAGNYASFYFVPTVSGYHTFSSGGSLDTVGYLLNASGTQLTSNDDGGGNYNFAFTYDVTAGTTYIFRSKLYNSSATGSFTVSVTAPNTSSEPETSGTADLWDGTVATSFGSGSGTSSDPYLIYTAEQLARLAQQTNSGTNFSGVYFELMNNIDLGNREWTPIGKGILTSDVYTTSYTFRGIFDGNYHTIRNMKISSTSTSFTGLFGCLYGAQISNLGITDATITGNGSGSSSNRCTAGILAGASCGTTDITRVFATGSINIAAGNSFIDIAGLIGDYYATTASDCYAIADITTSTSHSSGGFIGGLFGFANSDTTVRRNFYKGRISYNNGSAGAISGNDHTVTDSYYCSNLSDTSGTSLTEAQMATQSSFANFDFSLIWTMGTAHPVLRGFYAGGTSTPHTHSYSQTVVAPTCTAEGYTLHTCACGDSYQDSTVPATGHTTGTAWGHDNTNHWKVCTLCDARIDQAAHVYDSTQDMICNTCGFDKESVQADIWDGTVASAYGGGSGTQSDPYLIYTAEQLAYLAQQTNNGTTYSGKYFKLMSDLDLCSREWTPIGKGVLTDDNFTTTKTFRGSFDGNYHTIRNMKISTTGTTFTGLFGCLYGAKISNLGITDASVAGSGCGGYRCAVGILAGGSYNQAVIEKVFVTGNINVLTSGASFIDIGALIGEFYQATATNCYAIADVTTSATSSGYTGGLYGFSSGVTIERNFYKGTIRYNGGEAGAVSGEYSTSTTATVLNTYYCANLTDAKATSLTASQMAVQSNFTNFDFTNVWDMGSEHPVLQGFGTSAPHSHTYTETVVAPTCTAEGYTLHTCTCGDSYQDSTVPATGHTPGETWEQSETGHWQVCTACDAEINEGDHAYDNDADCICNSCGFSRAIRGDMDCDGDVDSDDAIYLLLHTHFSEAYPICQAGDMDGDGDVDSDDAIYLLLHTHFSEEYPLLTA